MTPDVTAVIVNHNGGENILRCVEALHAQALPLAAIVVVDNGSSDGSPDEVARRFPGTCVLRLGANRGLSAARNAGLRAVGSRYALLLDDDVYVRPDTVLRLREAARRQPQAVLVPRVVLFPEGDTVQTQGAHVHFCGLLRLDHAYRPLAAVPDVPEQVGGGIGACYFGRTESFTAPGGFDELIFFYFEDLEFSLRLRALDTDFVTAPAAVVDHDRGAGTPGLSFRGRGAYPRRRAYYSLRHRRLTVLVHYRARTLLLLAPALFLYDCLNLAFVAVQGWGRDWFRGWAWLWRRRGEIRARRRRLQSGRARPDRDLLVGGKLPLAPGLVQSAPLRLLLALLELLLNLNWLLVRRFV